MKVNIEMWQDKFNGEWHCNITTTKDGKDTTEYWAVEDFVALLEIISVKIPNAKCIGKSESKMT